MKQFLKTTTLSKKDKIIQLYNSSFTLSKRFNSSVNVNRKTIYNKSNNKQTAHLANHRFLCIKFTLTYRITDKG